MSGELTCSFLQPASRSKMMKPNGVRLLLAMVLGLMLYSTLAHRADAQPAAFKVGDRIEANVTGKWQPGTIVRVQPGGGGDLFYLVNTDGEGSNSDRWNSSAQI